ncbi:MAG: TerB family tellurite resistance protein [Thermodesulfobacteriota bacterium]
MGWLGKMVGGTIGFALGGPLGAIAGAAFGHMFDAEDSQRMLPGTRGLSQEGQSQVTFFVAAFSMLAKIARVDGRVTDAEMDSIRRFMTQDLSLNSESQQMAEKIFNTALQAPQTFSEFAHQFQRQFHDRPELLQLMLDILIRVSVADGALDESEEDLILQAVKIFRIPEEDYHKIKSRYVSVANQYYAVLGCGPNDSDETVKKQYRKLVRDFHPDTIAAKGLPDDFIKFANDKFREIQEAYEAIKKERGMS